MKAILHKAATRGHADHGWLESWHSFSFAGYYNPERMHFGALRVLNDDTVAADMGFGRHPHDNMEIISIPTSGELLHEDNMGHRQVIRAGDVQAMSAGTGIQHSEKNNSRDEEVRFFQIWVFPNLRNVEPRYDQKTFSDEEKKNRLVNVVAPMGSGNGAVEIYQNAWFYLGDLDRGVSLEYQLKDPAHGVYIFLVEGNVTMAGESLNRRDAIGITGASKLEIRADSQAEILVMEVPMSSR